jgi:uncharacterized protein YjbI with pentapeptide repeats
MALARGTQEIAYAASLLPCPSCGAREHGALKLRGSGNRWAMVGTCPTCNAPLSFAFDTAGDPLDAPSHARELGKGPSAVLTADQLRIELARVVPLVPSDPRPLDHRQWRAGWDLLDRALVTANELAKLASTPDVVRQLTELRALEARYKAEGARVHKEEFPHPRKGELDKDSLRAHVRWLQNNRTGDGRLDLASIDLSGVAIGTQQLTGARFAGVKLVRATMRHATLDSVELIDVDASDANLESVSMRSTRIVRGRYVKTRFAAADLEDAQIEDADLTNASFDLTFWKGGTVRGAKMTGNRFGNARIEGTVFQRCELRGSSFAAPEALPEPTTQGVRFEDCDLRETDWAGRDLSGVSFVRCKLTGAHGAPKSTSRLVVQDCDVTSAALLGQLR